MFCEKGRHSTAFRFFLSVKGKIFLCNRFPVEIKIIVMYERFCALFTDERAGLFAVATDASYAYCPTVGRTDAHNVVFFEVAFDIGYTYGQQAHGMV